MAGDGVKQDDVQAVTWFRKAADQGVASAQYNLGLMYEFALGGLTKDLYRAEALYRRGCDGGNATGCEHLKRLLR